MARERDSETNYHRIGAAAAVALADAIRKRAEVFPGKDGRKMVRYHEGWNDAKVAAEVEEELGYKPKTEAVTRFRQKAIGDLENKGGIFGNRGPFAMRLAGIEDAIATLTIAVNELREERGLAPLVEKGQPDSSQGNGEADEDDQQFSARG